MTPTCSYQDWPYPNSHANPTKERGDQVCVRNFGPGATYGGTWWDCYNHKLNPNWWTAKYLCNVPPTSPLYGSCKIN